MGRIIVPVTVGNYMEPDKVFTFDALVDTGASHLVLPMAWRERMGALPSERKTVVEVATHERSEAIICGPVRLQISGFAEVSTEVMFLPMQSERGDYEPLLGYIPLEQSQVAVDMRNHRLGFVEAFDLK